MSVKTAVLVSGRGSNLRALLEAKKNGRLPQADICLVISNKPDAAALEVAQKYGVPAAAVDQKLFGKDRGAHERAIIEQLHAAKVEFIVLAGYMRLLTPALLGSYENRIINIHPSLLPAFPGIDAQRQAIEYGVKISGCTVHFVSQATDAGPIILQRVVPIVSGDNEHSLAARILIEEHKALPLAVDLYTRGLLRIHEREVEVLPGDTSFPDMIGAVPNAPELLLATGNNHKVKEIRAILADVALNFRTATEFTEHPEPEENALDYLGNARIKARAWTQRTGLWTLADDSGLEVDALDGQPGVLSARYARTGQERIAKLLKERKKVPDAQRTARCGCTVVLRSPDGTEHHETGACEGRIDTEARGANGFGYDPIFIPEGFNGKHLAELADDTKNSISHRARALFALKPRLEKLARGES
ncbi:hypothetical protein BH09SUM1_BH09SUM1_24540 [soil metagenome]